jgi:hypothetical protein
MRSENRDPEESRIQRRKEDVLSKTRSRVHALALVAALAGLAAVAAFAAPASTGPRKGVPKTVQFRNVRADSERFIDFWSAIALTPAQARIRAEALTALPAPCCSDYTMEVCCCPCNLAKSAWGLSHYLIAKEGYNAPEVKAAVQQWLRFVNPGGFSGNACSMGGCKRPFARNGCGGMDAERVIVGDDVL